MEELEDGLLLSICRLQEKVNFHFATWESETIIIHLRCIIHLYYVHH